MRRKRKDWTSAAARRIIEFAGGVSNVEAAVDKVALRLLEGILCPPTDLASLKDRLNVNAFEPIAGLPVAGELRKDGDRLRVVYSAGLSPGRRRFTLAHELSHAVFERTGPNCPRYGRELETICDMLASELLMPRRVFLARSGATILPSDIYQLAREFDTSIMATARRCNQLLGVSIFQVEKGRLVWGCGAIRHQRDLQHSAETFKDAIAQSMLGAAGEQSIYLRGQNRQLQWVCPRGQHRSLFILQPLIRRPRQESDHRSAKLS